MTALFNGIIKILKGDFVRTSEIAESYDDVSKEYVENEVRSLVQQDILTNVFGDYYITNNFESDQKEKEALKEIHRLGNHLHQKADTRTEVKITGELVEDKEFKTDRDPASIIK